MLLSATELRTGDKSKQHSLQHVKKQLSADISGFQVSNISLCIDPRDPVSVRLYAEQQKIHQRRHQSILLI